MKKLVFLVIFMVFAYNASLFAEEGAEEHLSNLSSGNDNQKIAACDYFGKEKDSSVVPQIITLLRGTENPKVASAAAIALGNIQQKGEPTTALKDRIMMETNTDVVYSSILALMSITIKNEELEPDAKAALDHASTNHNSDVFVADLVEKIKRKLESKKSE